MRILLATMILSLVFGVLGTPATTASELSGYVTAEGSLFFHDALFP